jgi:hypothetical protein
MTATEHLYFGFGQIVYSLAFSDGDVQASEKSKLEEIISQKLEEHVSIQVTSIIFTLLEKDTILSTQDAFDQGIKNMKLGDNHLNTETFDLFIDILEKVAIAFPPNTELERLIISKFKESFNHIN